MSDDVTHLFNQFVGKEVRVTERVREMRIAGQLMKFSEPRIAEDDTTVKEIEAHAEENGLTLRTWFPESGGTTDHKTDRVNIDIEKDAKGKWRVGDDFTLG